MAMASCRGLLVLISPILQPTVTKRQQPVVTCQTVTFGSMATAPGPLTPFAERLIELCVDKQLPARGRQTQLAKLFKVSQQAARKWLDGRSYPETDKIVAIADWAGVNVNWLLQGVGPKHGNRVDAKALVLDEAVRMLPRE